MIYLVEIEARNAEGETDFMFLKIHALSMAEAIRTAQTELKDEFVQWRGIKTFSEADEFIVDKELHSTSG